MATETISFRIRKELRELAKRHKIDISKIAKEKVEEELAKVRRKEQEETFEKTAALLAGVTEQDIVRAVRKIRESR